MGGSKRGGRSVPGNGRAKGDDVTLGGAARERTRPVVVGVRVRSRAATFEEARVRRRLARTRPPVGSPATVLVAAESVARATARHRRRRPSVRQPQLRRARPVDVGHAFRRRAVSRRRPPPPAAACLGRHRDGEVEAVHQADVEEVHPAVAVEGELGQRGRWGRAGAGALDLAGFAVAGGAGELAAGGVLQAEGPGPYSAGPTFRHRDLPRLILLEGESRRRKRRRAAAGEEPRPDGVVAVVRQGENCRKNN